MAIVRKHIYFSGQVQGVGFRYRAKNAARANDLTGWVDNLWDGRVEMEVQGELSGIERMIQEIESCTNSSNPNSSHMNYFVWKYMKEGKDGEKEENWS